MPNFGITTEGPRMFFLEGELDVATIPLLHTAIGGAVSRGGPLTIDMSDVSFVDSSGVGAILNYVNALPSGCIVLHGVHDGVGKGHGPHGCDPGGKLPRHSMHARRPAGRAQAGFEFLSAHRDTSAQRPSPVSSRRGSSGSRSREIEFMQ